MLFVLILAILGGVMSKVLVDNSGQGNCMYYAYGISLMYFLRKKNDRRIADILFDRLGLSVQEKGKLHALLEKERNKPFTSSHITQIIEPILAPATRKLAAESSKKNYFDKREGSGLFAAANYGMIHYCKLFLADADPRLAQLLGHNTFNNTRYTEAEIFRVHNVKSEMQTFLSIHGWQVIDEFNRDWPVRAQLILEEKKGTMTLEEIESDNFYKQTFLAEIIGMKTLIFFEEDDCARLNAYSAHINTNSRWGTDEILGLLHHELQGEIPQDGMYGYVDTKYEIKINLHIYKNGAATAHATGIPDMVLNNIHNTHWTSLVDDKSLKGDKTPIVGKGVNKNDGVTQKKDDAKPAVIPIKKDSNVKSGTIFGTSESKKPEHKKIITPPDSIDTKKGISVVPTELKLAQDKKRKLQNLQRKVWSAAMDYCDYSNGIWFSFFHRHGSSGRKRARDFATSFYKIEDYDNAKDTLAVFLKNKENGNTHPHSFRTMLLYELLEPGNRLSYKNTSDHFNSKLDEFTSEYLEIKENTNSFTL